MGEKQVFELWDLRQGHDLQLTHRNPFGFRVRFAAGISAVRHAVGGGTMGGMLIDLLCCGFLRSWRRLISRFELCESHSYTSRTVQVESSELIISVLPP